MLFFSVMEKSFSNIKDGKQFNKFVLNFANQKLKNKFDKKLINSFISNTNFIKRVIELDRSQPEFKLTLDQYLDRVITKTRIKKSRLKYKENQKLLEKIGNHFKVQPRFIVALWGIETDFGRVSGYFPVISSLATLVYDGRRAVYFEKELLNALKIIKDGHIKMSEMKGSWAGAMGQCQFMPSSFVKYAKDWNKDGKKDIWKTKADVFASAANYLNQVGWNNNQTWGRKVFVKKNNKIKENVWQTIKDWKKLGLLNFDKSSLPDSSIKAKLILDKKNKNHGFLVYSNFESILKWNRSNYFALAVGKLSDSIMKN